MSAMAFKISNNYFNSNFSNVLIRIDELERCVMEGLS